MSEAASSAAADPQGAAAITRRIITLASARALNTLGRQIISVAVGWELYARTRSALTLGLVGLVQVIPVVLLFLAAGNAADASSRRSARPSHRRIGPCRQRTRFSRDRHLPI